MLRKRLLAATGVLLMLVDCGGMHRVVVDTNVNYPLENKLYMLAILPFEDNVKRRTSQRLNMNFLDDPGNYVAYYFGTGLTGLPHFKIVERNSLESIFREQNLDLSGLLDQEGYKKIGKLANADFLLVGRVNDLWWGSDAFTHESCVECTFRIVSVETGETLVSSSFTVHDYTSDVGSVLSRAVNDVAKQIRQKLR
jgi:hypothetical protein